MWSNQEFWIKWNSIKNLFNSQSGISLLIETDINVKEFDDAINEINWNLYYNYRIKRIKDQRNNVSVE